MTTPKKSVYLQSNRKKRLLPGSKEFNLRVVSHYSECRVLTKAGFPEPTISSKLEGVNSITLLAVTPFNRNKSEVIKEKVYKRERILKKMQ